jgi:hypothetical protein
MVKHGNFVGIPRVALSYGVGEGCVLRKNHQDTFEIEKSWRENT